MWGIWRSNTPRGEIKAIVVFGPCRFFGLFGRGEDYYIPWECVQKFGCDIVIVDKPFQRRDPPPQRKKTPLGRLKPGREDKTQILRKNSEKQLAIYICLWYYISAFRTAPDFRSVPARVGRGRKGLEVKTKNQRSNEQTWQIRTLYP